MARIYSHLMGECVIIQNCYHFVTLSVVEGSHVVLCEMFRLRFAPLDSLIVIFCFDTPGTQSVKSV